MMKWNLNGNGISFLTDAEQARVNASTNPDLKFKANHGFVYSEGMDPDSPERPNHLLCGENIIGTWAEPATVAQPPAAPVSVPAGSIDLAPLISAIENLTAETRRQTAELAHANDKLTAIAASSAHTANAVSTGT